MGLLCATVCHGLPKFCMSLNITVAFTAVVSLSAAVERLVEAAWIIIEAFFLCFSSRLDFIHAPSSLWQKQRYARFKTIASLPMAILIGVVAALWGGPMLTPFKELTLSELGWLGAVAGFLAPYAHQLIELGFTTNQRNKNTLSSANGANRGYNQLN